VPTAKALPALPPEALAWYDKLIATLPEIERKGVSLPYTAVNGNMFSFLSPSGAAGLRLPVEARETFLKKHKTTLMEQPGAVMAEYVTISASLLKRTSTLKSYLEISYAYAKSLKPKGAAKKPTTKKANARKKTARQ
jgi:hypothetical protein